MRNHDWSRIRKCRIKPRKPKENRVTVLKYLKNANYQEYATTPSKHKYTSYHDKQEVWYKNAQTKGKSCHCTNISRMLIIKNMLKLHVSINTPTTMTNRKFCIKNAQTQENHVTAQICQEC